jgi:hypothetical protein
MIDLQGPRVAQWLYDTFGGNILFDLKERLCRLAEETIELTQAEGQMTREEWHQLVDEKFDAPPGVVEQEQGGVMVCLAAYEAVKEADLHLAFETEMARIEEPEVMAKVRAKRAKKKIGSKEFSNG